jgi:hypothetical protein
MVKWNIPSAVAESTICALLIAVGYNCACDMVHPIKIVQVASSIIIWNHSVKNLNVTLKIKRKKLNSGDLSKLGSFTITNTYQLVSSQIPASFFIHSITRFPPEGHHLLPCHQR